MTYVDGYFTPVPVRNKQAYLELSAMTAEVYREHGALRFLDCWPDSDPQDRSSFHAEQAQPSPGSG